MERSKENVEIIHLAIQQLMDEKKNRQVSSGESFVADDEDHLLLSRLLSQLESLKGEGALERLELLVEAPSPAVGEVEKTMNEAADGSVKVETEEIVKELREVRRQNTITHWLLSVMIVVTVAWQLSEVSLILKVKKGLSNPFRSFGSMLTGMLHGPALNGQDAEKQSESTKQHLIEPPSLPPLKIPELPRMDFTHLGLSGEEED